MKHFTHFKSSILRGLLSLFFLTAMVSSAWGETKTEGFEKATAGNSYQGTITLTSVNSDCGIGWSIYYGNISTSSKISGNNSVALRLYTSNNYGYLKTTTAIDNLTNVSLQAKASTNNGAEIKINILYSTDGNEWTAIESDKKLTSSAVSYDWNIPSGGKYFQIAISSNSKKPSSSNAQLTIDDIVFTYDQIGGSTTPTALSIPSNLSSSDVTSTGATLSWDAVANASSYKVKIGSTEYNTNTKSYSATGLTAGTQYTWTVKAIGDGTNYSSSDYATGTNFTTLTQGAEDTYQYTHDFSQIDGFEKWSSSYTEHTVEYTDAKVIFASANKSTQTITDIPVTKGGNVCLQLSNNTKTISSVKFVCRQWTNKAQTITLKYSTDGGETYSSFSSTITSTNFEIGKKDLPENTNAVQISFNNSSNQVGIESVSYDLNDKVSTERISISGTPSITTYTYGQSFKTTGLSVTAHLSDGNNKTLASNEVKWSFSPATFTTTGENIAIQATASYEGKTCEYNGTVKVNKKASSINIENKKIKVGEEVAIDATTTPNGATLSYNVTEGNEFISIADGKITGVSLGTATIIASYFGTEEYNAAEKTFQVKVSDEQTAAWTANQWEPSTATIVENIITAKFEQSSGNFKPNWSSTNQEMRLANGNTMTISAANGYEITEIVIGGTSCNYLSTVEDNYNTTTKTWSGESNIVHFKSTITSEAVGIKTLTVSYKTSSKTPTSLSWSNQNATIKMDEDTNTLPSLTKTPGDLANVSYSSSDENVATINENGVITLVNPGTTIITAAFAGDETHMSAESASYTLRVDKATKELTIASDGFEKITFSDIYSEDTDIYDCGGDSFEMIFDKNSSNNAPKFYTNGAAMRSYAGNTITITGAEDIAYVLIKFASGYADDKMKITGLGTTTAVVTFSKTCRFTSITVSYRSASLSLVAQNSVGYWATFSSNEDVAFIDAATTVYTVNVADGVMTFNEVANKQVPAGNGVLLKTEEATATYVTIDLADAKLPNNMLKPGTGEETTDENCKFYRLAYKDFSAKTGLGFYYGPNCDNGQAFVCKAGTAYLAVPEMAAANIRSFVFDEINGNETGMPEIDDNGEVPLIIYTMTGVRIPKVVEDGLYIVNGKTKWMIAE